MGSPWLLSMQLDEMVRGRMWEGRECGICRLIDCG